MAFNINIDGIKDILMKMLDPTQGTFHQLPAGKSKNTPDGMLVKVINVNGEQVLLKGNSGVFTARAETAVHKGEILLLEQVRNKDETLFYRIAARTAKNMEAASPQQQQPRLLSGQDSILWSFLITAHNSGESYPVLLRYYPWSSLKKSLKKASVKYLELIVDTVHLGLVMIRINKSDDGFECMFLVESRETGEFLEKEARDILQGAGDSNKTGKKLIAWQVFPVREEIEETFQGGNVLIDARV